MSKYTFLIGKWNDRIISEGWHLLRFNDQSEDFIFRIVYCSVGGVDPDNHVDLLHEGFGCLRFQLGGLLENIRVIPINIENAISVTN